MASNCPETQVSDSYVFISTQCLPSSLVTSTELAWIIIFSMTSLFIVLALVYTLKTSHRYAIPATVLSFALLTSLSLIGHVTAFYLGATGFARMIAYGLPMSLLITGVTYLISAWFSLIISSALIKQENLQNQVKYGLYIFNGVYHVVFWGIWLAAGAYGPDERRTNNGLVAGGMLWLGLMACLVSISIFLLGRRLVTLINGAVELAASLKKDAKAIERIVKKIAHYSYLQSLLWLSGGTSAIAIGLWGVLTLDDPQGMGNFFFVMNYWLHPAMLFADLLLVYAAVNLRKRKSTPKTASEGSRERSSSIAETSNKEEMTETGKSKQEAEIN